MRNKIIVLLLIMSVVVGFCALGSAWDKTDDKIKQVNDQKEQNNGKHLGQGNHNPSEFKFSNNGNKNGLFSTEYNVKLIRNENEVSVLTYNSDNLIHSSSTSALIDDSNFQYIYMLQTRDNVYDGYIDGWIDNFHVRQYADVSTTVTDMGSYYKISVTNNEASDLTDYQVQLDAATLGITSDTESWKFYTASDEITTPSPGDETTKYSTHIDTLFENSDSGVWGLTLGVYNIFTDTVGGTVFWLLVLPLPFVATWIKQQSVVIPTILYLVLGSVFIGVAPASLQKPAFLMLGMGVTGMMFHIFKNRR